jgi:amino acid permease
LTSRCQFSAVQGSRASNADRFIQSNLACLRGWLSALLAALVFGLTVSAASPSAHRWLHDEAADSDDACAVVLFAFGAPLAMATIAVVVRMRQAEVSHAFAVALSLVPPRYLRLPERGPPLG